MIRIRAVCAVVALLLCIGCAEGIIGATPASDRVALFDDVWREFDLHYSFFELKKINWDSLGAHYRPLALGAGTDQQLAGLLTDMLSELDDVHVSISATGVASPVRHLATGDTVPAYFSSRLIFEKYVPTARCTTSCHVRYGMATPTVGYLRIARVDVGDW